MSRPPFEQTGAIDPAATHLHGAGQAAAQADDRIGGYRLLRTLGAGGMGVVYEGEESASGRRVAVKVIAPQFVASPDAVERFRQEGRLASGIVHPRCVFVLAADEEAGRPYIVMELMPGTTLKDLVDQRGPLPIEEAVARMIDVIDGLQPAHAASVIHRDVKPSNCFLDDQGRVKIGDFGLSKSLVADVQLSQTGQFLGTLLFASPEQIRGEPIDQQTDVYSVAATLHFLLAGKAPFEGGDAAATVARIVADPPTPLRKLRPDVPHGLEAVVLRGLERNRQKRWRNLAELREALVRFLPEHQTPARRGPRVAAYLIDTLVLLPMDVLSETFVLTSWLGYQDLSWQARLVNAIMVYGVAWLYFSILDGGWGFSPGKWLLRLRVIGPHGDPPGLMRSALRTLVFVGVAWIPAAAIDVAYGAFAAEEVRLWDLAYMVALAAGIGALFSTARAANGYRGLHDWAAGTRVIGLPWPVRESAVRQIAAAEEQLGPTPPGLPQQIGPYVVRGALAFRGEEGLLLAEDAALGRNVWIEVLLADRQQDARRESVTRPTRLRWLASGTLPTGLVWRAFVAPNGQSITRLAGTGLVFPWSDVRPMLDQLTDELSAAVADGTLPDVLAPEQVRVDDGGAVQLLDWPMESDLRPSALAAEERTLSLLRQVALMMLEGRPQPGAPPRRSAVRAPIPEHASGLLSGLFSADRPYHKLNELKARLLATQDLPTRVTTGMRAGQLAVLGTLLSVGLGLMLLFSLGYNGLLTNVAIEQVANYQQALHLLDPEKRAAYLAQHSASEQRDDLEKRFADPTFESTIREALATYRSELVTRHARTSWLDRRLWPGDYELASRLLGQESMPPKDDFTPETFIETAETASLPPTFMLGFMAVVMLFSVGFFPLVWIFWPLLVGPGVSYRIAGISLVSRDGRPANHLQCAWRALLIWGPIGLLMATSLILQSFFIELGLVCLMPAWLALGLLLGYVLLALWYPTRALHDVLSGTWLVPR